MAVPDKTRKPRIRFQNLRAIDKGESEVMGKDEGKSIVVFEMLKVRQGKNKSISYK